MEQPFVLGTLKIQVEDRPQRMVARWDGRSEVRDASRELDPFLNQLLARAERSRKPLELRFENLEHFNSNTVGALLRLINSARDRHVSLELTYDSRLRWQSVSFEALSVALGPGPAPLIRIRPVERVRT